MYERACRDNRRKHNSHEWFFHKDAGFCAHHRPSYAFATDCSTLYEPNCLKVRSKMAVVVLLLMEMLQMLVDYMDLHDDASACTGRQRVKTVRMQGSEGGLVDWCVRCFVGPCTAKRDSYLIPLTRVGRYFRSCQRYDFESSFACFMGAFALVGFLPVIPGPCGIYRWKVGPRLAGCRFLFLLPLEIRSIDRTAILSQCLNRASVSTSGDARAASRCWRPSKLRRRP